jgi:hypothetical protein
MKKEKRKKKKRKSVCGQAIYGGNAVYPGQDQWGE